MGDPVWSVSFLTAFVLVAGVVGQAMLFHATTGKYLAQAAKAEDDKEHTTYEVTVEVKEEPKPEEEKEPEAVPEGEAEEAK